MPFTTVNGLRLCFETVGDPTDPPILLVAGLGVQLIDWADYFVDALVQAGHFVIRYDNRDAGLSSTFDGALSDPLALVEAMARGESPPVAYTLRDMASDAAGLIEALGLESAHIVGVSMGGMIAQQAAISFPQRIRSLTSIMSSTGASDVGQPKPEALAGILTPATSTERDARIVEAVASARIWASPEHYDPQRLTALFEAAWDRVGGPQAENSGRHFCAILASEARDQLLANLRCPALVVHGTADPLVPADGGERTAASIPDAALLLVEGMGHDLPPAFTPRIVTAIADLVARAEAA